MMIASLKPCQENPMGKTLTKEKEYNTFDHEMVCCARNTASLKPYLENPVGKTIVKEKEYSAQAIR